MVSKKKYLTNSIICRIICRQCITLIPENSFNRNANRLTETLLSLCSLYVKIEFYPLKSVSPKKTIQPYYGVDLHSFFSKMTPSNTTSFCIHKKFSREKRNNIK